MRQKFITNALDFLLQNVSFITKWDDFITKCDSYYKIRRLLQIAAVQLLRQVQFVWM